MLPFVNAGENPGGLNMDPDQPAGAMLADPAYSQVLNSGDTDWSAAETIPFSFDFNGNSYTSIYIAPNGVVSFTASTGAGPGANVALPAAGIPDNSICAWGLNLAGANDGVIVKTHGTAPNRQYWVTWASASWSQGGGWAYWSIVLEETSNAVYIVDARNYVSSGTGVELTAGIQYDGTTAISVPGSPALAATNEATGGSDAGPVDNSYYAFYAGTQPDYDATMRDIDMPNYIKLNQGGENVMATISNFGAQTITDLELSYTINGGAPVVATVSGLSIASGTSASVTHPTVWDPTTEGTFVVEFWASKINGNVDADPNNDKTDKSVDTYTNSYPRTVLYETFTSSTCGPCVPGNANFESVISGIPAGEFASIKYQMSWPGDGDPYNTDDGNDRRVVYQVSSVPGMQVDGGWDGNSNSFTQTVHDAAMEVPAFVKIEAFFEVDPVTQTVSTCANIQSMKDLGAAELHIAIKENLTTGNVGTNGETEFRSVVKKMAPTSTGQAVTITSGMSESICTDYVFQGSYRLPNDAGDIINDATEHSVEEFNDLGVVVWLQNSSSLMVYNSTNAVEAPLSVKDVASTGNPISMYPNPAGNLVTLSFNSGNTGNATVRVMDVVGKTVLELPLVSLSSGSNQIQLNTESLVSGIYLVQVNVNGKVNTSQLVIRK